MKTMWRLRADGKVVTYLRIGPVRLAVRIRDLHSLDGGSTPPPATKLLVVVLGVLGLAFGGCMDMMLATQLVGKHRYMGDGPGCDGAAGLSGEVCKGGGDAARMVAYERCTVVDNSSFEALDACMAKSGYQRRDR